MPLQFSSLQFWSWTIDLLRKHRESYVWYCFFNLIMLENRAQMPKTLQIFSYGSVYSYSRMLYHQHGLCSAELRRTQRFISKCTVMNVFLEMLSYTVLFPRKLFALSLSFCVRIAEFGFLLLTKNTMQ